MTTRHNLHALLVTFDEDALDALKSQIAKSLPDDEVESLYSEWHKPEITIDLRRALLASKYPDVCLNGIIAQFTKLVESKLQTIAERISATEIDRIKLDLVQHLDAQSRHQFDVIWGLCNHQNRLLLLASKYATAFRKTLLARYIDDLYGGIERAVVDTTSPEDPTGNRLRIARRSSQLWRMAIGVIFALIGAGLILSNLSVLPAMAKKISTETEHPAALAIGRLSEYLQNSSKDDNQKAAIKAIEDMAGKVTALTNYVGQLAVATEKIPNQANLDSTRPTDTIAFKELLDAMNKMQPPAPAGKAPTPAPTKAESIAAMLVAAKATADAASQGVYVWRRGTEDVTVKYLILPINEAELGVSARSVAELLESLATHYDLVSQRKATIDQLDAALNIIGSSREKGLLKDITDKADAIDKSGQALNELRTVGPRLAEEAQAATDVLSSVSKFVLPYAFAVLAIGAMFVSLGITSVLKSLRLRDDAYDEAVDLNRTLMLSRLAIAFQNQDSKPDALIERLARIGERSRKGEAGVPMPIARALTELVDVLKKP